MEQDRRPHVAATAEVLNAQPLRFCRQQVVTIERIRSTKRLPSALWVPKQPFHPYRLAAPSRRLHWDAVLHWGAARFAPTAW